MRSPYDPGAGREHKRSARVAPALSHFNEQAMGWPLQEKDIKRYPHFDRPLPLNELTRIASTPAEVIANKFLPFLHYEKSWTRFREPGKERAELQKSSKRLVSTVLTVQSS
jgi:hypothetical protein